MKENILIIFGFFFVLLLLIVSRIAEWGISKFYSKKVAILISHLFLIVLLELIPFFGLRDESFGYVFFSIPAVISFFFRYWCFLNGGIKSKLFYILLLISMYSLYFLHFYMNLRTQAFERAFHRYLPAMPYYLECLKKTRNSQIKALKNQKIEINNILIKKAEKYSISYCSCTHKILGDDYFRKDKKIKRFDDVQLYLNTKEWKRYVSDCRKKSLESL